LLASFHLFFERSLVGKALRACASNRLGARLVGIPTALAGQTAFALAAGLGAVSGILIGPIVTIYYDSGFLIGLKAFVAAIVGGLVSYPPAALAAIGVGLALGLAPDAIARTLGGVQTVPGRFEQVRAGQPFLVVVDYAHTPDALERVLATARKITAGRVGVVFGCGGDRDRTKRPIMGEIAARLADHAWITSDNPRSEDPDAIVAEVAAGAARVRPAGNHCARIADREAAIRAALGWARSGDTIVIAGKGHETYQIVGGDVLPFDDREVARRLLSERAR
jgi:hypothetical protein